MISLDNVRDGETINQRALLIHGRCPAALEDDSPDSHVIVQVLSANPNTEVVDQDVHGTPLLPEQRWPMCRGYFKALVILPLGTSKLVVYSGQNSAHTVSVRPYHSISNAKE